MAYFYQKKITGLILVCISSWTLSLMRAWSYCFMCKPVELLVLTVSMVNGQRKLVQQGVMMMVEILRIKAYEKLLNDGNRC